ncbi:sugar ABC transporter substrate-binding protein [Butyricicoccus pullicaecorum]|uniref:Periplasmic binding protein domain-containing protein n=1 Tax=Butyricicoccus pullicaecorum 1.2 TaxID=1203606 RepID=R8VUX8_9FIRM|nr:sugar ABC transporter substrate-binding protein [Butyricicoccus pullicaecorum]EOQ36279.1 hypothetical protein HMPREF1526_02313 [Butyricicoccus pullicaecorum 1.2]SKA65037.1 ribose transport system substrate-binding protein [Butyricicoccus pullicaecorum DSM 23266]
MKQSKKRVLAAVLSGMFMIGSFAGCGGGTTTDSTADSQNTTATETTTKDRSDMTIKVVLKTLASEYWQYVQTGCKAAGRDLGVNVEVLGATSETAYEEQIQIIETTLNASDTDAMVVAPLQADSVANQIANTSIPVVAIDTQVDSDKVLSFVGFDNEEMAELGGKAAAEAAKEAGWTEITAIGIAGVQGDSTSEARMKGYQAGIEASGGTFLMDELQYANSTADQAVTCMEAIVQNHPEGVSIIFANNDDMAIAAKRVVEGNPAYENTIFCGCGGNTAAMEAILNGEETMTVAVDGYDVGYRGVQAAVEALEGKTPEKFIASPATIVTIENAEEHLAEVQKKENDTV